MFLNIITPCSRPQNLHIISQSINIPKENYRWIVVFDFDNLPDKDLIPNNCETYLHKNPISIAGHSQRNFALKLIDKGHVYMNDDDTIIHKDLWDNIKDLTADFISFSQENKDGTLRLMGDVIQVCHIDSHNFIVSKRLIENEEWIPNKYDADGNFASFISQKSISLPGSTKIFIPKILSTYNSLR